MADKNNFISTRAVFIRVGPEKEPMGTDACMRKLGRTSGNPKQTNAYEGP